VQKVRGVQKVPFFGFFDVYGIGKNGQKLRSDLVGTFSGPPPGGAPGPGGARGALFGGFWGFLDNLAAKTTGPT